MSEVRRDPIKTEDTDGNLVITFTEDHTIRDIIRYLLSTGVDAAELIYHINDPELLAKLEGKARTNWLATCKTATCASFMRWRND